MVDATTAASVTDVAQAPSVPAGHAVRNDARTPQQEPFSGATAPSAFELLTLICRPFLSGSRVGALPQISLHLDGQSHAAPGPLLPTNADDDIPAYFRRIRAQAGADTWHLHCTEPLHVSGAWWGLARTALRQRGMDASRPFQTVSTHLHMLTGPTATTRAAYLLGDSLLLQPLHGRIGVRDPSSRDDDNPTIVEPHQSIWLSGNGRVTVEALDDCMVLELRAGSGNPGPEQMLEKVLGELVDSHVHSDGVPNVPYLPFAPDQDRLQSLPEMRGGAWELASIVREIIHSGHLRHAAHLVWLRHASTGGLAQRPPLADPGRIEPDHRVALDIPDSVVFACISNRFVLASNGHLMALKEPMHRLLESLQTGLTWPVAELTARSGPDPATQVLDVLHFLHRSHALTVQRHA